MTEYTSADIINFTIDGNKEGIEAAVDALMKERVAIALDAKKTEVARNIFTPEE